jgi:hypothetical protein
MKRHKYNHERERAKDRHSAPNNVSSMSTDETYGFVDEISTDLRGILGDCFSWWQAASRTWPGKESSDKQVERNEKLRSIAETMERIKALAKPKNFSGV